MANIYYRFEMVCEDFDVRKMILTAIFEPDPLDYVRSFFGLFSPWPSVREREVGFFTNDFPDRRRDNHTGVVWYEENTETPCSPEMCEMLEVLYNESQNKPGAILIGRP